MLLVKLLRRTKRSKQTLSPTPMNYIYVNQILQMDDTT